jgi:acetylglutamate kinase
VGDITEVNTQVITMLLNAGKIPVISSIGVGDDGSTYNINADYAAAEIAKALRADKLILMTDVDGVLDTAGKLIPRISHASAEKLITNGTITGGMIPKIKSALDVLDSGVKSVHIINGTMGHAMLLEILTSEGVGTMVVEKE